MSNTVTYKPLRVSNYKTSKSKAQRKIESRRRILSRKLKAEGFVSEPFSFSENN